MNRITSYSRSLYTGGRMLGQRIQIRKESKYVHRIHVSLKKKFYNKHKNNAQGGLCKTRDGSV